MRQRGTSNVAARSSNAWLDRFVAICSSRCVLDLGCGSGEPIARYLLDSGCAITGVDSSRTLIEICRSRFPGSRWLNLDMRTLAMRDTFGGILAWDSFFHLSQDDQRRMMPIFAAHAAPGAALMFTSGSGAGEAVGTFCGEPLYHASLDPAAYRTLLDATGFDVIDFMPEDPSCGGHSIWLARRR
jgi:SAM-dependent methyltransferase